MIIKVLVLGAANAGKTSLVERYCNSTFSGQRRPTIGCDFKIKKLQLEDKDVILQVWDTAGAERFQSQLGSSYYRNADGALLVYDCSSEKSTEQLVQWRDEALSRVVPGVIFPVVVVANKVDLLDSPAVDSLLRDRYNKTIISVAGWCSENCYGHVETSAKEGNGVEAAMMAIAALSLEAHKSKPKDDMRQSVVLHGGRDRDISDMYAPQKNSSCNGKCN